MLKNHFKFSLNILLGQLDHVIFNNWNQVRVMQLQQVHVLPIFAVFMLLLPRYYQKIQIKFLEAILTIPYNELGPCLGPNRIMIGTHPSYLCFYLFTMISFSKRPYRGIRPFPCNIQKYDNILAMFGPFLSAIILFLS